MNLPNKITITRICLIPLMVAMYYITAIPYCKLIAGAIFAIAAMTDFVDGYLARKYNQVTNMGKFLDPIADKVLVIVAFLLIVESNVIPAPFGMLAASVIVARELIISGFRQIAAANNVVIAADRTGKIKTVFQDASLILLFVCSQFMGSELKLVIALNILTYVVLCIAVLLTVYSGVNYVIKNKKVILG